MAIITKKTLEKFAKIHPTVSEPLNNWHSITHDVSWKTFADVKQSFNSVDAVGK
jgi:mRNA interferase HigB